MIEEVTLQGFKSYRHRQRIQFTKGVNKISGRNASGKTTLLEAVIYGLYGEVPRVDKKDLVSINGGNMIVSVVFRSPHTGKRVKIFREGALLQRKRQGITEEGFKSIKNMLEVEGEPVLTKDTDIQKRLRELIGVGKNTFLNVIYAQQKEFVEILNPSKNRMDAILGLTAPTEIREQLRETRRMLEKEGRIGERGALEERIRGAEEYINDATVQITQIESRITEISMGLNEKKSRLNDERILVDEVEDLSGEFRRLERNRNELETLQGRMEDRVQELESTLESMGENPLTLLAEITQQRDKALATEERLTGMLDGDLSLERRDLDSVIGRLLHQLKEHKELHDQGHTVCPKCGQPIDHQLLEGDMAKWREDLDYRQSRLRDLELEMVQVRDQVVRSRNRRINLEKELSGFHEQERRIEELKRNLSRLEGQARQLSVRINQESEQLLHKAEDEMGLSFADLDDAQNRIRDKLNSMRESLGKLEGEVRSADTLLNDQKRQLGELSNRVEGYRKVIEVSRNALGSIFEYEAKLRVLDSILERYRSYEVLLRENTLRNLEWLTLKYFERLTDQQLYSGCHIDRDRYTLEIQPQDSGRLLPAWRAGGGHESLFALAERLALLRVKGFPHMLILDEPTDAVDSENVPQLLEYIAKSSQEIGQVLLVTHHGQGEEEGVNLIRVRKVAGESRVYQEFSE